MKIEVFESNLTKDDCKDLPFRKAIRGIIKKDGKYLVVHLKKFDITTFPGGGIEDGETYEDCVVREVLEETGIKCIPIEEKISVTEYFTDSVWTNVYLTCEFVEDTLKQTLTDEEKDLELSVEWKTLDELMDIFENNMTLHENGPTIHNREFLGLIHSIEGE